MMAMGAAPSGQAGPAGHLVVPLLAEHRQLGFLAGGEQEIGQERDAIVLGVEPGDPGDGRILISRTWTRSVAFTAG
jgi:hypothetical protein